MNIATNIKLNRLVSLTYKYSLKGGRANMDSNLRKHKLAVAYEKTRDANDACCKADLIKNND